ncbi:MAG: alanyl-tRNA editing protein [Candidatus Thermoplasmatota archaeon]|jgi:misacylated tRNA(Ala) deacylase|nr:alanyl-tRNA editing protein [Candidatus Thermoplasmatota archaeon]MCL5794058.1 alanyl-tRNA editing protein [Candidatus Thermoplasmatota archaeon]
MTIKLYFEDSYLKEFNSIITEVRPEGVVLESTAFYPVGGGQPSDTGILLSKGRDYRVTEVSKSGDHIVHRVADQGNLKQGDPVTGLIDWERRYAHMRYHTAVHIIDAIVNRKGSLEGSITGSQLYQDRARVDFNLESLTREMAQEFVDEANAVARSNVAVTARYLTPKDAENYPRLARTAPGRELLRTLDRIRVVDIEGVDFQSDGGTHVSRTGEVGKIIMDRIESKGRNNKRLIFHLEDS